MKKMYYPAIFHAAEDGGFWVTFPDFPECMTQGDNWEDAYVKATDILGFSIDERLKNKLELPNATLPMDLKVEQGDVSFIVEFDLLRYKKTHNNKAVKKTLTIPEWLNEICIEQNINFSQVLQEALIERISETPLNLTNLTDEEIDTEFQKGLDAVKNGQVFTSQEVEAEMNRLYGI